MADPFLENIRLIAKAIDDKKGFNIVALDVKHSSSITDYIIIAEGDVSRHVKALYQAVVNVMHQRGESPQYVDGVADGDWIVIDYIDCIIHLFTTEMREKYALEGLWKESHLVDLKLTN